VALKTLSALKDTFVAAGSKYDIISIMCQLKQLYERLLQCHWILFWCDICFSIL